MLKCIVGSITAILLTKFAHFLLLPTFHDCDINPSVLAETSDGKGGMENGLCMCAGCAFFHNI